MSTTNAAERTFGDSLVSSANFRDQSDGEVVDRIEVENPQMPLRTVPLPEAAQAGDDNDFGRCRRLFVRGIITHDGF